MMIKFQQLSAFKAVYELGTRTTAVKHIHMTQPAVSRLIGSLEHQLGFAVLLVKPWKTAVENNA